ncbi:response regulator transcription factor [Puniceicoccales bacterium CK1056]|uniref:Phosphate regulon transcriptional regulatory protein PhoB n=1 Tax=Oceanipulchritudo coccoides TaxID=2706888 RepID=A0A6B2M257_9BACT|nr:response regulator transcription factor [Oceanipulchritudo coccoides]NDV62167.1 response regulator transcription factor [Oceanipulchritudo coccoides]
MKTLSGKRILIVDDEPDVTELISYKLAREGCEVEVLNDPLQVIGTAREFRPDLFILDIMMPELDGLKVCRLIRADRELKSVPVIFLTARGEVENRIEGLEQGGDDYIAKPFDTKELILRIGSVLKRSGPGTEKEKERLVSGSIVLDEELHQVSVAGKEVELTATEFKLLKLLMQRKGRVLTRENLLVNVWNYDTNTETRTIDTHIRRLREKLAGDSNPIETVRGVGYRFIAN